MNKSQTPSAITSEQVTINKDVYEAQLAIVTTVSDFLLLKHSPTEAIGYVLRKWLTAGPNLQSGSYDTIRLKILLAQMDFLYELLGNVRSLEYCEHEAQKLEQAAGGPSHD